MSRYLICKLSEFDEMWYAETNFDQGDGNMTKIRNLQIQDGGQTP